MLSVGGTMSGTVAVVGCGNWGKNLARNFWRLGALGWICDSDPFVLEAQRAAYPTVHLTDDFRAVLDADAPPGVVIASPTTAHYDHVAAALQAGKDVLVEKPLALRYRDGAELVERARKRGNVLMVGHVLEYHPAIDALKSLVRTGELGALRYIYSNRLNLGKIRREENILWSFAPHDISIITSLVGDGPVTVAASGGSYLQKGITDVTVTSLTFAGGIRGHIFVSWLHPHKEQRLTVIGDRKMAIFDDTLSEGKLRILDTGIEWNDGSPVSWARPETTIQLDPKEPLELECAQFLRSMATREEPVTGGENALRVLKVLEAAQISLDQGGRPVQTAEVREAVTVA
jgi:UDP-2-acetamido-3-amino-2,3-dideoxy-glucuronate N-acetyltransferase